MDGGTDFTSTEVIVIAIVGFGSALLGSLIGVIGAWFLQGRSDKREAMSALEAVLTEMLLNAAACRAAAKEGRLTRTRHGLRTSMWEAHVAHVVHALPRELFNALEVNQALLEFLDIHYVSIVDADSVGPGTRIAFLRWHHRARRLRELIIAHSRHRRWYRALWMWISDRRSFEEKRKAVRDDVVNYAMAKVRDAGYQVNEEQLIGEDTEPPSDRNGTIQDEVEEQKS